MNEKKAIEEGYNFTGSYSHDKEEMKSKAKEIRNEGFAAVVVTSLLSRGSHGMGYSVFAERKYFYNRNLIENKKTLERIPERIQAAKELFDRTMKEIDNDKEALTIKIQQLQAELAA
jgi:hypothetical protein